MIKLKNLLNEGNRQNLTQLNIRTGSAKRGYVGYNANWGAYTFSKTPVLVTDVNYLDQTYTIKVKDPKKYFYDKERYNSGISTQDPKHKGVYTFLTIPWADLTKG